MHDKALWVFGAILIQVGIVILVTSGKWIEKGDVFPIVVRMPWHKRWMKWPCGLAFICGGVVILLRACGL